MKLVSSAIMQKIDREAIAGRGIPSLDLMENAGGGIALRILTDLLLHPDSSRVAVFCGKGNNGGDGHVVARHLHAAGIEIVIYYLGPVEKMSADAQHNFQRIVELGVEHHELTALDQLPALLECDLVVDAIFGTGFAGAPRGLAGDLIEYLNAQGCQTVAVDLPSGLNADNGQHEGAVVEADYTYTLALPKFGLFLSPGRETAGDVEIVPIGIPDDVVAGFDLKIDLLTMETVSAMLPVRPADGHKGNFGRVLTIAGSTGMTGAAALSALTALRSGCGLSNLACPRTVQPVLAQKLTEVITHPMPDVAKKGAFALRSLGELRRLVAEHDAVVIGPGIGRHHETAELIRRLVSKIDKPTIIDADGLNALVGYLANVSPSQGSLTLTPHPGEFARLTGEKPPPEIKIEARAEIAVKFATENNVVLVLKGSPTLIAAPDGHCYLNPTGNNGMATGGSGDVLSGIIGTFLAQMDDPFEAAATGVFVHGLAGDMAAETLTPRAMIAGDMISHLPEVFQLLD